MRPARGGRYPERVRPGKVVKDFSPIRVIPCGTGPTVDGPAGKEPAVNTIVYQCLRLNWMCERYEWVTFEAPCDEAAWARVGTGGYLPESLSRAQVIYPAA